MQCNVKSSKIKFVNWHLGRAGVYSGDETNYLARKIDEFMSMWVNIWTILTPSCLGVQQPFPYSSLTYSVHRPPSPPPTIGDGVLRMRCRRLRPDPKLRQALSIPMHRSARWSQVENLEQNWFLVHSSTDWGTACASCIVQGIFVNMSSITRDCKDHKNTGLNISQCINSILPSAAGSKSAGWGECPICQGSNLPNDYLRS